MSDDIATLRRILGSARTIAVVGLSAEWHRPSYFAAKYMQQHGYRVIPVNPRYEEVLGDAGADPAARQFLEARLRDTERFNAAPETPSN